MGRGRERAGAALAGLLVLAGVLAGCSQRVDPAGGPDAPADSAVVVRHAFGEAVIAAPPERVVTLGLTDTQVAAALGANIVGAVRDSTSPAGAWPGIERPLPGSVVSLDNTVPEVERIALLRPDLILAVSAESSYLRLYDQLARIAPVVAYEQAPLVSSGEDVTRTIGRALFRFDRAVELIRRSDAAVEAFAAEHRASAYRTYVFGAYVGDATLVSADPATQSQRFLGRLGLRVAPHVRELGRDGNPWHSAAQGLVTLSAENLTLLAEADVALISTWGPGSADEFRSEPLVIASGLAASDRLRMIGPDLATPLLQPNPAVTDYLLRRLGPLLAAG